MVHQPYADLSDQLDSPLDETTVQVANNLEGTGKLQP